jgi:hypothetical protein
MVLGVGGGIGGAVTAGVKLADKSEPGEKLEGAVDCHQTDIVVLAVDLFIDARRGEVVAAVNNRPDNRPALAGELVAVTVESRPDFSFRKFH